MAAAAPMGRVSDAWAFVITLGGALAVTQGAHMLKKWRILSASGTRKACHIVVGIVYMLTWMNYSDAGHARWLAALVVATSSVQVLLVGFGVLQDRNLVDGMSRTGSASELLRGPLIYALVSAVWTLAWWRASPVGIVGLQALYLGDGLAGLVGGAASASWPAVAQRLPWSRDKTWAGSAACFLGTIGGSLAFMHMFAAAGQLHLSVSSGASVTWAGLYRAASTAALAATLVESLPVKEFDNLTVPLVASLTMAAML